eukprot:3622740-Rhodomonas_salina.1
MADTDISRVCLSVSVCLCLPVSVSVRVCRTNSVDQDSRSPPSERHLLGATRSDAEHVQKPAHGSANPCERFRVMQHKHKRRFGQAICFKCTTDATRVRALSLSVRVAPPADDDRAHDSGAVWAGGG